MVANIQRWPPVQDKSQYSHPCIIQYGNDSRLAGVTCEMSQKLFCACLSLNLKKAGQLFQAVLMTNVRSLDIHIEMPHGVAMEKCPQDYTGEREAQLPQSLI